MKAITVHPMSQQIRLVDLAVPEIRSPSDVKLRVLDVGVCGTDREICSFEYGTPPGSDPFLVIGHECLAEVVAIGSGVRNVKPGDLVVPTVRRPCFHDDCQGCTAGRQDFCFTGDFEERGIKGRHGFMTEFVVDDAANLHLLPAELRDVGVLVEPLTIAEKALAQVLHVQSRLPWACSFSAGKPAQACHRALVLGAGPVGLLGAMALRRAGFDTWVYSRETPPNPKAAIVDAIGGHYLSSADVPVATLPERIGNIDVVYEAVGASSLAFEVMGVLGTNGVFVFTGVPGRRGPIEVDTDRLMRALVLKNQMVFGTVNAGSDEFKAAIDDLTAFRKLWPDAVRSLITGRYPLSAHRDLLTGTSRGIKNVLTLTAER